MAWDLTSRMAPFLDVHLLMPLLDSMRESGLFDSNRITLEKIKLVDKTNMISFVMEEYAKSGDADLKSEFSAKKADLEKREEKVHEELDNEPESVKAVAAFFADSNKINELKSSAQLTLDNLANNHDISNDKLLAYYQRAKFIYECGLYVEADTMLCNFLSVSQPMSPSLLGALWGRLASHILQAKWEDTVSDFAAIKEAIEARGIRPLDQLRQRAWLLHWGLFVHCNKPDGIDNLVDLFTEKTYLQTMENLCPWLLRYYTAAVILSPNRRSNTLHSILTEIQDMAYLYSDPVTQFLQSLYTNFDFDEAQVKLKQCQELIKHDFFLQIFLEKFIKEARVLICEMYCSINRKVDLVMLSKKLQLSEEEAEKWMVDMVRNGSGNNNKAYQDARIDSSSKQVLMALHNKTAHEMVFEKTNDLTQRGSILSTNLEDMLKENADYLKAKK